MDYTTKHEGVYGFWTLIQGARVYVAQEESKHPKAEPTSACPQCGFNTSSATIAGAENRANVLYGAGSWLSPEQGAYEVTAHDPGIGVSFVRVQGGGMVSNRFIRNENGACEGIQCPESYSGQLTYLPSMANGEDSIELYAEDAAELYGYSYKTIKVDAAKPYDIHVKGMPEEGAEISAAPHTLTLEATDGTKPTPSSGVKSITVSIDGGQPVEVSGASCAPGECTGKGEWTLHAENVTEGEHRITVTATDNAGNKAAKDFYFDVRHAAPVAMGPGAVDPTTGQFSIDASDVSLGGVTGVARAYQSRNLAGGAEGPLGSQWAINLGAGEGLTVLPTGGVVLGSSGGGVTTFARNKKGEYESPVGDGNLKVEAKEEKKGKGITEYVMADAAGGTATHFTQPAGERPTFSDQFGAEAGQLKEPESEALDSEGNLWVVDFANSRIARFSPTGLLLAAYGSYGSEAGQFKYPWGIAVNQSTGNVYVTDQGNNRVEELSSSGSFIRTFGWGVSNGNNEFEVCTKECQPGIAGTGSGQFKTIAGVSVDSSGNVWVADFGNSRLEEFNENGSFTKVVGTEGSGNGQFKEPLNIAFSGASMYVVDYGNSRIEQFSMTGGYEGQFGKAGSGNKEFKNPYGIATEPATGDLYVVDSGNGRVQEFTPAGGFITKFGTSGTGSGQFVGATGIAVSPSNEIYVADGKGSRVEEWARSTWLPTISQGPLASGSTTYSYQTAEVGEEVLLEPAEALAPAPPGVSCSPTLEKGCRALTFNYASSTTATGELQSQWGDYKGHLTRVYFTAWDPAKGSMSETAVAQYTYDSKGRLRAEWDPRISPALKTIYGYDAEGHITAVTRAGQETVALTYGTTSGDSNAGRLLKETQAPASAPLWKGEAVANSVTPKLSGSVVVGGNVAVSPGTWSGEPVAYGYQWYDCNSEEKECAAILGATNANYSPSTSDIGHKLMAQVTATNGGGSLSANTTASAVSGAEIKEYAQPSGSHPFGITSGPDENLWFTDSGTGKVGKITAGGETKEYAAEKDEPEGITAGPDGNLWFVEHTVRHVNHMTTSGALTVYTLTRTSTSNVGITSGPDGNLWFTESEAGYVGKITSKDEVTGEYKLPGGSQPYGITTGSDKNLWFTDFGTGYIGKVTTSGTITEYKLPSLSGPYGITAGSNGNLWFTDCGTSKIGQITTSGAITEYALPSGSDPRGITPGPEGNLWFTDYGTSKIGVITTSGTITEYALPSGSQPTGITVGADKNIWFTEYGANKIGTVNFHPSEGEHHSPGPGVTIEYHVPASGSGAPYNLGETEVSKWGQTKDPPVEGMAIFPPDEPQGWPASDYKRATIQYLDAEGRRVNTVGPTGGIATTEYNALNEAARTLSADNRAAALKEACESKEHCKSAEVAAKLDNQSTYNTGGQLVETLGPEHKVKLASGSEVLARNHMVYHYDEGAPETGEEYSLVTKTTDGALYEGKEADVRTTLTSYAGQKGLGWTLRKPTSVTTDPAGLNLTSTTEYNETTGNVVATKSPAGSSQTVAPPSYSGAFGSEGSGSGQFKDPEGVATDASGNVWVVDMENSRIEKFSGSGSFSATYGSGGTGGGQFSKPQGIAISQGTGGVYVSDTANNRVEKFSSTGTFELAIGWGVKDGKSEMETCATGCKAGLAGTGNGQLHEPTGLALDSKGDIWVADEANARVQEFSPAGEYLSQFGSKGSGNGQFNAPSALAVSEGEIYVADTGNSRIEVFSPSGTYLNQFGSSGAGQGQFNRPAGIAVNPNSGDLYVSDTNNYRMQEFTPAGKYLTEAGSWGTGKGQFHSPVGMAINAAGDLYVADIYNNRVQEWLPPGAGGAHLVFSTQFGSSGSENGQVKAPRGSAIDGQGNLWVTDDANHRIQEFSATGKFIAAYGSYGTGNGQFKEPTGIDVNQGTGNVYISDCANDRVQELSSKGEFIRSFGSEGSEEGKFKCPAGVKIDTSGNVWVADSANNRVEKFSSTGTFQAAYGSAGSGDGQFKEPWGLTFSGSNLYVVDYANNRVQELSSTGSYVAQFGSPGNGGGQFKGPEMIATDAAGNLYVTDNLNHRIQEFSASGTYLASYGTQGGGEGQLQGPEGIAVNAAGDLYVSDSSNRIEIWAPNNPAVHDTKTIYYTAKEEAEATACRNHPEWVGLPCESTPAAQPESGLPELPVKTYTYNLWDEVETTTETVPGKTGSTTRTEKETYDSSGRALSSETTSTIDTPLPRVTNEYSSETGALVKQSATIKGETKTIASKYNTLGQLTAYTDAEDSTTEYAYDIDGRPTKVSYELPGKKTGENIDSQVYSYDPTTGLMTELHDTAPAANMTFTASYDAEGNMVSEGYPNGMSAGYTLSPTGQATTLEYVKLTHCSEKCTWFSDSVTPAIHGETLAQTSTLSSEYYSYDTAGRLAETQETPAGKGCATRVYAYDEDSNRTSLTTREPGTEGKCATEGGSTERHVYDPADRLNDEGITYETFGNATTLPANDAGGHELTSEYYLDGQVATQKQNGETLRYFYDPAGRTMEAISEGTSAAKVIDHYAGPGEALAWVNEGSEKWTRNIPGIDGALAATQQSATAPTLQLHDLQGNIIATAALSETETKLLTTYNSTEFGVPQSGTTPPKYAWLGAGGLSSEPALGSGVTFKSGASYVPQVARTLQTFPVIPPGAFPNGLGPATPYTAEVFTASFASAEAQAEKDYAETEATRQKAKEQEEKELLELCQSEGGCGAGLSPTGGGAEEEGIIEGTIGDPVACNLHVANPNQDGDGFLHGRAWFECTKSLHNGQFELCLRDLTNNKEACTTQKHINRSNGQAHLVALCEVGHNYDAWAWVWEPGSGDALQMLSPEKVACWEENVEEEELWIDVI